MSPISLCFFYSFRVLPYAGPSNKCTILLFLSTELVLKLQSLVPIPLKTIPINVGLEFVLASLTASVIGLVINSFLLLD